MKIVDIRTLSGPNIWSHVPVIVMTLDLEDLTDTESTQVPGFIDRLLNLLPGLYQHRCSRRRPGGFVERLREGTYFGHITEHVALELTEPAGIPAEFGKTVYADAPGHYHVIVEFQAEQAMIFLLRTAVEIVNALVQGDASAFPLAEKIKEAQRIAAETELGPSTRSIVDAAQRRGIPWIRLNQENLIQLGYGKHRRYIQAAMTERTSAIGMEIASDKQLTKTLLERATLPVPRGVVVQTVADAVASLSQLRPPVVVKPLDGRQGKGVSLNLSEPEQVAHAFELAREFSHEILVEELFRGSDYRVLVVGGKMIAASKREPAHVIGDGVHTIEQLVGITNRNPLRGEGHEKPLTRIVIDSIVTAYLNKSNLTLDYVPNLGEKVCLREGANLSTGGTATDVTDIVHPETRRICERAARILGLDVCGVDLIVEDICQPIQSGRGGIIEINAAPGLRMHIQPSAGESRPVGEAIVEMLYPSGSTGRIPIISITGTNGKTTVTRLIGHVLADAGLNVGVTTTDGVYIGHDRIVKGDTTGPISARTILADPSIDVAVLETARGGIARRGLGYDWSDIGVITNVRPDHIGQDGIRDLDDLVHIKSLVAERVREGGTLILNADDERASRFTEIPRVREVKKKIVYYALSPENHIISTHLNSGGTAYFVRNGWIIEARGTAEHQIVPVGMIPITMGGIAEFNVSNSLAAVAACRAYRLRRHQIATSLLSFRSESNPGRANLYQVGRGYVLLDYGHNPDAFTSICRMASKIKGRRVTGIVGVPGDRADSVIEEAARVAARGFDRIIVREDYDLRGRQSGQVAELLCKWIKAEAPERECTVILDDREALTQAIDEMQDGELVVLFYDELAPLLPVLERYGAEPANNMRELEPVVAA